MARNDGRTHDSDYTVAQFTAVFGGALVLVTVPNDFLLTLPPPASPFARLSVPAGTTQLPALIASHPWARLNGVH